MADNDFTGKLVLTVELSLANEDVSFLEQHLRQMIGERLGTLGLGSPVVYVERYEGTSP